MVKNLKLKIKNTQLAGALKITKIKSTKKKATTKKTTEKVVKEAPQKPKVRIMKAPEAKEQEPEVVEEIVEEIIEETPSAIEVEEKVAEEVNEISKPETEPETEKKEIGKITPPKEKKPRKVAEEKSKFEEEETKSSEAFKKKDTTKAGFKGFKEFKTSRKKSAGKSSFDSRDKQGLRGSDEGGWRKKRPNKNQKRLAISDIEIVRPKNLTVRLPITVKMLAQEMNRKASELITKLFMQGITMTLNDRIDDETLVQLIGHELDCEIQIDTTEEELIQVTGQSVLEEIQATEVEKLKPRSVVLTFMGHVDHGKTSLIDSIRRSSIADQEAGAITQHIGAFRVKTDTSEVTILDTPGHEAFTEMRLRGAYVTDIVILVVAGDEGIKDQTLEAIEHAKKAKVPIVVAINKCDKPSFDPEKVYRQLADIELLPEAWGGTTITVNCSAVTKEGLTDLLEMAALQAEVLELRADPSSRARGTILESEMHKGMGPIATCLIQNGTLKLGDAIVFGTEWGRVKTMQDEHLKHLKEAAPSTPVKITGLSNLAEAGCEFIVVSSEKEAKKTAIARREGQRRESLAQRNKGLEHLLKEQKVKKVLPVLIKADVQGSLEALKNSLYKIKSDKAELNIIHDSIGEVSESDVQLAAASSAVILGFHTRVEAHAEPLIKQTKTTILLHDIIYHAVDDIKLQMTNLLDPIAEENDKGSAEIKAVFKSSQLGLIAGCQVLDGSISRNHRARVVRDNEIIWSGKIASLKRNKDDAKEVQKDMECGILLEGFKDFQVGDIIQAFEIIYIKQTL